MSSKLLPPKAGNEYNSDANIAADQQKDTR